jgi:predicted ATPase
VVPAIAQALGVSEDAERPLGDALAEDLRDKELLLVLDRFEHVLEAAPMLSALVRAAPRMKLLTTSRVPLNLYGEHQYDVHPIPDSDVSEVDA